MLSRNLAYVDVCIYLCVPVSASRLRLRTRKVRLGFLANTDLFHALMSTTGPLMPVPRYLYDSLPDGIVAVAMLCFALPHTCVIFFFNLCFCGGLS